MTTEITLENKKYGINYIGEGGFAKVYKAIPLDEKGKPVAIKKISKEDNEWWKKHKTFVEQEIEIHQRLDHRNIVKLYKVVKEKKAIYMILELCETSLDKYVKKLNEEKDVFDIFKQIVEGVKYLHSRQIIHRDLKLQNILLTKDMTVKIADFGLSTRVNDQEDPKKTFCGTRNYMAPEIRRGKGYTDKVDCWNLGCVLYALFHGSPPVQDKKIHYDDNISREAKNLLDSLLKEDHRRRICIEEVEKSNFFKNYEENSKLKNSLYRGDDSGNGSRNHLSSPIEKESHFRSFDSGFNSKNSSREKSKSSSKNNYSSEKLRERRNFDLQKDQLLPPRRHLWSNDRIHDRKRSASEDRKPYNPLSYNISQQACNSLERSASAERARIEDLKSTRYSANACQIVMSDCCKSQEKSKNNDCGMNSARRTFRSCHPETTERCDDPSCKFRNSLLEGQHNVSPSTCSHTGSCNTKCSHVATCCYQSQSDHQRHLSNINNPEKLNKHSLVQETSPLNAARLRPKRYMPRNLNNTVLHISEDCQVIMEVLKTKKRKAYVSEVFFISTNGMEIKMFKPPKNTLLDDEYPPPFPKDSNEIKSYDYQKLPKMYHGRYLVAKQFVDILRAKKPKLINNGKNARFYVMENSPDPDMKMEFYDGGSVVKKGQKICITDKLGRECVVFDVTKHLDQDFRSMLEEFLSEKEDMEEFLKLIESHRSLNFPVVLGELKNTFKCSGQKTGKENVAPTSSKNR